MKLSIPNEFSLSQIGEAGAVSVGATEVTVQYGQTYTDPIVVAVPVTTSSSVDRDGSDAAASYYH